VTPLTATELNGPISERLLSKKFSVGDKSRVGDKSTTFIWPFGFSDRFRFQMSTVPIPEAQAWLDIRNTGS
jgi:hypothetical protein